MTTRTGCSTRPLFRLSLALGLAGAVACTGQIGSGGASNPSGGSDHPTTTPPNGQMGPGPGSMVSSPLTCVPSSSPSVGVEPLRRLNHSQYNNSVRDLLGIDLAPANDFTPDEKVGPFFSNASAPISDLVAEEYLDAAEALSDAVMTNTTKLSALLPCTTTDATCGAQFIDSFGLRAFRRPLTPDEHTTMVTLFASGMTDDSFNEGVRRVIQAMLESPQFLYRIELGPQPTGAKDVVALDQYLVAGRLSYYLWGSMPDAELFRAAGAGELSSPDALRAQAKRLLADPRAAVTMANFHQQWLGLDQITSLEKDMTVYPNYSPDLRDAMAAETGAFTDYVIRAGDGKLETLLTAPFSVLTAPLATLYGATVTANQDYTKPVNLNPNQRAGLLTEAGVLAVMSHAEQSSPIRRGKLVREQFFCQTLSPPPPGVDLTPPAPDPNVSSRQRFEKHRTQAVCAACHALIDPIGFGLENYDGIGAFLTMEAGQPVDSSGTLTGTDVDGDFHGALELSQKLSQSAEVRSCVAQKWFNYAFGRTAGPNDGCSLQAASDTFNKTNNIRDLLVELVATDAFRYGRFEKGAP
ncbi:MAG TPA: DUF1592 domain-containing protein [Polyangia bacterium]|jgi:hypothetical protein